MNSDLYKKLLQAEGGSIAGANTDSAVRGINNSFVDSPFYVRGKLDGGDFDWILDGTSSEKNQFGDKVLLLRPYSVYDRGDYLTATNDTWIVVDKNYENPIFPKASVALCNESLRWKDQRGNIFSYPCSTVPYRSIRSIQSDSYSLNMPEGHIFLIVQLNDDTRSVFLKQRFILGSQVYEISGVDDSNYVYKGKGYLYFTMSIATRDGFNDDFVNQIADNSSLYAGSAPQTSSLGSTGSNTTLTSGGVKSW